MEYQSEHSYKVLDFEKAMEIVGGNAEILKTVALTYIKNCPERWNNYFNYMKLKDYSQAARIVHSFKGASASLGGSKIIPVAKKLEITLRSEQIDFDKVARLESKLQALVRDFIDDLKSFIGD